MKLTITTFKIEEFFQHFPNLKKFFSDDLLVKSPSQREHALVIEYADRDALERIRIESIEKCATQRKRRRPTYALLENPNDNSFYLIIIQAFTPQLASLAPKMHKELVNQNTSIVQHKSILKGLKLLKADSQHFASITPPLTLLDYRKTTAIAPSAKKNNTPSLFFNSSSSQENNTPAAFHDLFSEINPYCLDSCIDTPPFSETDSNFTCNIPSWAKHVTNSSTFSEQPFSDLFTPLLSADDIEETDSSQQLFVSQSSPRGLNRHLLFAAGPTFKQVDPYAPEGIDKEEATGEDLSNSPLSWLK